MNYYTVKICDKEISISKTRGRAIKAYCTDCSAGNRTEVKECPSKLCPLYIFRGYVDWQRDKKEMSEEDRFKQGERLRKARQDKKITP